MHHSLWILFPGNGSFHVKFSTIIEVSGKLVAFVLCKWRILVKSAQAKKNRAVQFGFFRNRIGGMKLDTHALKCCNHGCRGGGVLRQVDYKHRNLSDDQAKGFLLLNFGNC